MPQIAKNKALMIILSAPSGGGKTSIAKRLLEEDKKLSLSISATTRDIRPGEIDGVDYFFISKNKFEEMKDNDQFLEYAEIYGNYYGTQIDKISKKLSQNFDILFDIDYQGAYQIVKKAPSKVVTIFIMPPNIAVLEERLKLRAQDSKEVIYMRLELAKEEISHSDNYDYVVVNDDFERAVNEIQSIIKKERKI